MVVCFDLSSSYLRDWAEVASQVIFIRFIYFFFNKSKCISLSHLGQQGITDGARTRQTEKPRKEEIGEA